MGHLSEGLLAKQVVFHAAGEHLLKDGASRSVQRLIRRNHFIPVVFGNRAAWSPKAVDIHQEKGARLDPCYPAQVVIRIKRLTETRAVANDERSTRLWLAVDGGALPLGQGQTVGSDALRPKQRLGDPVAPLDTAIHADRNPDLKDIAQADAFHPSE